MAPKSIALLFLLAASVAADCPTGSIYESYFDKCYQFFSTPMSFLDAEQQCNALGGHLADVQNAFENSYIAGIASGSSSKTPNFWIGANLLRSSIWSWTSKAAMSSFNNWAAGQPRNGSSCAYVKDSDLNWVTLACNTPLPFMCKISSNATIPGYCPTLAPPPTCNPPTCPTDAVCTEGYTLYSGNCLCYKYYTLTSPFNVAQATCAKDGGILANAPTKDVNDFLTALPGADCSGYSCPYIGITCQGYSASSCSWSDGTPLGIFTNFYRNTIKPSSFALVTNEDVTDGGKWEPFSDFRYFMCQRESTRASLMLERKVEGGHVNGKIMTSQVKL